MSTVNDEVGRRIGALCCDALTQFRVSRKRTSVSIPVSSVKASSSGAVRVGCRYE